MMSIAGTLFRSSLSVILEQKNLTFGRMVGTHLSKEKPHYYTKCSHETLQVCG